MSSPHPRLMAFACALLCCPLFTGCGYRGGTDLGFYALIVCVIGIVLLSVSVIAVLLWCLTYGGTLVIRALRKNRERPYRAP